MAVQSKVAKQNKPMTGIKAFNNLINTDLMRTKIYQMVGRTDAQEFITSITSAVNNNPALAECDSQSIISAALLGQSLHLKPSPQLGYFYMVPYSQKEKTDKNGNIIQEGKKVAQFQIGYKGYLQLAIRSNEYVDIDAMEIRQGEYLGRDKFTGKPKFEFFEDDAVRENLPVVGYMAYFEMKNGYLKQIYWSKEKMLNHADKYSQAFSKDKKEISTKYGKKVRVSFKDYEAGNYNEKDEWMYSSFWYKNFDEMAKKTMLRQLLSKHALLSTESITKAVESDQAVIDENLNPHYVDNENIIDGVATEKEDVQTQQIEEQPINPIGQGMFQQMNEQVLDPMEM